MSFPQVDFLDVVKDVTSGNVKTKTRDYLEMGKYAIIDQGQELIGGYSNDNSSLCKATLPVIIFGDHTKHLKYIDFPFCLGADGTKVLRPKTNNIDEKYLYYFLQSIELEDAGYSRHYKFLKEIKIPLPPLPEQKRIAAILDHADALRRQRQRALNQLNKLSQSIFYDMFGDPRVNKHQFATVELSELIRKDDKINYGVVQPGGDFDSGVPLIRAADISSSDFVIGDAKKIDPEIEKKYLRSRLKGDEILIACVGSVGATCLARSNFKGANIARAVSRVSIDSTLANREFIFEQIKTPAIQNYFTSEIRAVAQPTLNIKHIKETKIIFPPLEQQNDFSQVISELESKREKYIDAILNSNTLFASLQQRAFRGEL